MSYIILSCPQGIVTTEFLDSTSLTARLTDNYYGKEMQFLDEKQLMSPNFHWKPNQLCVIKGVIQTPSIVKTVGGLD